MDFYKIFKTLNSAQSSWQISLAIILGLFSGFLPFTTLVNLFIILIAFSINIPLVIFFLMGAVFASLAILLDPLFASFGYEILTNKSLESLFSKMYNYQPTLLSSYNHTIVMGSFVISLLVSVPLFFILNKTIDKYRTVLETKFENSKYFSWLNPYTEENLSERPGVMRWWGFGLFVLLISVLVSLVLFVIDPIVKYSLEYGLSKVTNSTVKIQSVKSEVFNGKLNIDNINIYAKDETTNIDNVVLVVDIDHLLGKKLDFEIISFGNISFNNSKYAEKTVDHEAEETKEKLSEADKSDAIDSIGMPSLSSVDSLLEKEELESIGAAKKIKKDVKEITDKYKNIASSAKYEKQAKEIKKKINALKKRAQNINSIDEIPAILKDSKELQKDIKSLNSEIKTLKKEYNKDKKTISGYIKDIKTLPSKDYDALKNRYTFDQDGATNFIGRHVSSALEEYIKVGLEYYDLIKPYLAEEDEKTEDEKRLEGQWIKYNEVQPYPDFVIKKLGGSITKYSSTFSVDVKDISSDQKIYKKPLVGLIEGNSKEYKKLDIDFMHNTMGAIPLITINSNLKSYGLDKYKLASKLSINDSIIDKNLKVVIKEYKNINAVMDVNFTQTTLTYIASKTQVDKTIASILSNIDTFYIGGLINGDVDNFKINIDTDLDKKVSKGLEKELKKRVEKYKKELKEKIESKFAKEIEDLDIGEFNSFKELLDSDVQDIASLKALVKKNVSQKAMEGRLKKKAEKKLKKKLADKIKKDTKVEDLTKKLKFF